MMYSYQSMSMMPTAPTAVTRITVFIVLAASIGWLSISSCTGFSAGRAPSWALRFDTTKKTDSFAPEIGAQMVRAPLKYIGPHYPCLSLWFPDLGTRAQRSKNVTGVSLDFILDTASNTNIISDAIAAELQLPVVGGVTDSVGGADHLSYGKCYMLGEADLEGLYDPFTFIRGLTASSSPVASPAVAGILGLSFLQRFRGGVDFRWGETGDSANKRLARPAHVTFFGDGVENVERGKKSVPIHRIPVSQLPSVSLWVNGIAITALLDTGSPITVLNPQAARLARIDTVQAPATNNQNPLDAFSNYCQRTQAASRGDLVRVQGINGKPVELLRSQRKAKIDLCSCKGSKNMVDLGWSHVYVGDLPSLANLGGLGLDSPPAIVLGVDILRNRNSMLLRAQDNLLFFE